uniref:Uncharacterized protein n=1 Tax=Chrysotila carterae TaxID=13221 RepID=A0A7S4C2E2_CHRCT|mmetsp:Transcript_25463/g.53293  ORF Transcript_25463/g.53293 Transcript_25463/m.53293 type:complete len:382 (-) Transcript_25463:277-1422(-)
MRQSGLVLVLLVGFLSLLGKSAPIGQQEKMRWRELAALDYKLSFDKYIRMFDKKPASQEYAKRKEIFLHALNEIKAHNNANHSWKMGLSEYTDFLPSEWKTMVGYDKNAGDKLPRVEVDRRQVDIAALPKSVDWRLKGVVTPVKNQGSCGSCWAFSATEVLESHVALNTGLAVQEYAPQEFVDCAANPKDCGGTGGCQGSTQWIAFNYSITHGMISAADYPYKGSDGACRVDSLSAVAGITGYERLPANDYAALMHTVATKGPIAVSVAASWGMYEEGVFDGECGTTIDHAVVLVGYGTENGVDYWLVRNSWGASWGDGGYIKIRRFGDGKEPCGEDTRPGEGTECKPYPKLEKVCGLCGILSDSSYPTGGYTKKMPTASM